VTENIHTSGLPEVVGLLELRKLQELIRSRTTRIAHRMHLIIAVDVEIATGVPVDRYCSSSADSRLDSRRLCRRTAEAPPRLRGTFLPNRGGSWLNLGNFRPNASFPRREWGIFARPAGINLPLTIPVDC
jgi:hypothetical protein